MDLFKLLGTIAIDNSEANRSLSETSSAAKKTANDISDASEEAEESESKWKKALSKVGSGALAFGKVVATGMAVAGGAVAGLVTKSIQSYADYEQLVGGVETLFKDSAGKVQEYAKNAYKTAGLSANEYMETVTSFSASLLQSLDGDTTAAAEKANVAITDMSDNANKMGTDMASIQTAYQGFAKQNYTMLDNLKLGYGGTKEEMERLLADAQAISGIEYDISSYADVVDAIHVIQTEMGITGTTAKEASSTISGSIASMKGSWQNLLTAISSDDLPFDDYVNSFVDSVSTVVDNLMPRVEIALNGVVSLIDKLAPVIIGKIPELFKQLLPSVISAATGIINGLVAAFPDIVSALIGCLPALIKGFRDIFNGLIAALPAIIQALVDALPTLIRFISNALEDVFVTLCTMLPQIIQPIIEAIPFLIELLVGCLLDSIPGILDGIMTLITSLLDMLPTVIPMLVDAIVEIVRMVVTYLPIIIPDLLNAVMQIIEMLAEQLPVLIPILADALILIITMLTEQLPVIIPMLIDATITIVNALVVALPDIIMALVDALPGILAAVWDAIVMVFQNLPAWFGQLFDGVKLIFGNLWEGIKEIFAPVGEWLNTNVVQPVVGFFTGLWEKMKSIWDGICNAVKFAINLIASILDAAFQIITLPFRFIWENCKEYVFAAWEWIKENVSAAINAVKDVITKVMNAIKGFLMPIIDAIKNAFSKAWNAIKNAVTTAVNAVKSVVTTVFNAVKNTVSNIWNGIKDKISNVVNGIKDKISNVFNSVKNTVGNIFNSIKEKMSAPIEKAKETISGIVEKIKGFFTGMKLEFPKIKMPHFSVSPDGWEIGDLLKGSIPKLSVDWYAKAMNNPVVMKQPTIFGYNSATGKLMGGGEAGSEVVTGTNTLMQMIGSAVENNTAAHTDRIISVLTAVLNAILSGNSELLQALLAGQTIKLNEREVARTVRTYA